MTAALNVAVYAGLDWIIWALRTPAELVAMMHDYLRVIFAGLAAVFLYNFFASLLRSLGDSATPLAFLAVSAGLNIVLDLWFVAGLGRGVAGRGRGDSHCAVCLGPWHRGVHLGAVPGACPAGPGRAPAPQPHPGDRGFFGADLPAAVHHELGILAVQGLVNSFGTTVMAAFAAAVKIDAFAYLPVQDFGNAFSIFISQNYGAGQRARIRQGIRTAAAASVCFGLALSGLVFLFAPQLMALFIDGAETAVIAEGVRYLRIEGAFYALIGLLFLLYGLYRALGRPGMSVVLTVISLGLRVSLAYALAAVPGVGVVGIWWSVPVGWLLADAFGLLYYRARHKTLLPPAPPHP